MTRDPMIYVLIASTVTFTITGQLLFKAGMLEVGELPSTAGAVPTFMVRALVNPKVLVGFVLAVLYIRTRALIIPIICHVLINGLALGMGIAWDSLSSFGIIHIFNRLLGSQPWFGLICLALSVPWVAHFMCKNWPSENWSAPYFA